MQEEILFTVPPLDSFSITVGFIGLIRYEIQCIDIV